MLWPYFDDWLVDLVNAKRAAAAPRRGDGEADEDLARRVADRLGGDVRTCYERIDVRAHRGVVILDGTVSSADARKLAGTYAWSVRGTFDVCNALVVEDPDR
ncbi:BON domain-containing protein [Rhizomonospora bruguierae]|uniref:BON domain-containing protein n=1 Tax=Rhizomonospora bruguierae TaxID=1581705 RepID=UPI001BCE200E|nr:BON domain-containing protein [Micromonospora sp. NBRC 107566]